MQKKDLMCYLNKFVKVSLKPSKYYYVGYLSEISDYAIKVLDSKDKTLVCIDISSIEHIKEVTNG